MERIYRKDVRKSANNGDLKIIMEDISYDVDLMTMIVRLGSEVFLVNITIDEKL